MIAIAKEKKYLAAGWKMSEFMQWIPYQARDEFLTVVGEDNYVILTQHEAPKERLWRARLLISPEGVEILNLFFVPPAGHA